MRTFRAQAAKADESRHQQLAERSRRAIERLRKQIQHKISDMLQRDARRHRGISEEERLGLEEQLRLAAEGAIKRLERGA